MGKPKKEGVDAQATAERRDTTAYYRYDGNQKGSLIDPSSGEPLGRVVNGAVIEATDAEHAARLERHPHFAKTTKAKFVEQQQALGLLDEDGNDVRETAVSPLDPNLDEHGVFTEGAASPSEHNVAAPVASSAATPDDQNGSSTGDNSQGGI